MRRRGRSPTAARPWSRPADSPSRAPLVCGLPSSSTGPYRSSGASGGTQPLHSTAVKRSSWRTRSEKEAREPALGASSLGRYDRSLISEADGDRPVLIGPPDLCTDAVELGER